MDRLDRIVEEGPGERATAKRAALGSPRPAPAEPAAPAPTEEEEEQEVDLDAPTQPFGARPRRKLESTVSNRRSPQDAPMGMETIQAAPKAPLPPPDAPPSTPPQQHLPVQHLTSEALEGEPVAWLLVPGIDKIPLVSGVELRIGRSETQDLTLPHHEVSRRHAVIQVGGPRHIAIRDEGSQNGTVVNGHVVRRAPLLDHDRLQLGPYLLCLKHEAGKAGPTDVGVLVRGVLEQVPLPELLELLSADSRSGTLVIHGLQLGERVEGRVSIADGRPIRARFGELVDRYALLEMLRLDHGRFELLEQVDDGPATITEDLAALLGTVRERPKPIEDPTPQADQWSEYWVS
jgi:FHA domain/Domain of unknown function (DUF4388)